MHGVMGLLASVMLAGAVGFLAERTRVRPVAQSVGATLIAAALVCLLQSAVAITFFSRTEHLMAVSFALTPALGGALLATVALALAGHWFMGWVRPIAAHRPLVLALLAGVFQGFIFPVYPSPQLAL